MQCPTRLIIVFKKALIFLFPKRNTEFTTRSTILHHVGLLIDMVQKMRSIPTHIKLWHTKSLNLYNKQPIDTTLWTPTIAISILIYNGLFLRLKIFNTFSCKNVLVM